MLILHRLNNGLFGDPFPAGCVLLFCMSDVELNH